MINDSTIGRRARNPGGRAEAQAALRRELPVGRLVLDPDVMRGYSHDQAEWAAHTLPDVVVRPRKATEVQTVVRLCVEHGTPLVTRGAGTGLSGGAARWRDALSS